MAYISLKVDIFRSVMFYYLFVTSNIEDVLQKKAQEDEGYTKSKFFMAKTPCG